MPICVVVPHETVPGERRVALVPTVAEQLAKQGVEVLLQAGAGAAAFYRDSEYASARLVGDRAGLFGEADIPLTVQPLDQEAIGLLREGSMVIGFLHPHEHPECIAMMRDRNITSFAVEAPMSMPQKNDMVLLS